VDDWQALFFTLLHFSYSDPSHERRHLPWATITDRTAMWCEKLSVVQCQSQTLMQNVQPPVRSLLTAMHHALFKEMKTDVGAVKNLLTQFVAGTVYRPPHYHHI